MRINPTTTVTSVPTTTTTTTTSTTITTTATTTTTNTTRTISNTIATTTTTTTKWAVSWEKRCAVWDPSNAHVQPLKRVRDVALCLKLAVSSFIVWANSEGSGKTARMCRLAWDFAVCLCNKYPSLMRRLKFEMILWICYFYHVQVSLEYEFLRAVKIINLTSFTTLNRWGKLADLASISCIKAVWSNHKVAFPWICRT